LLCGIKNDAIATNNRNITNPCTAKKGLNEKAKLLFENNIISLFAPLRTKIRKLLAIFLKLNIFF
jgi:hypothetical protein